MAKKNSTPKDNFDKKIVAFKKRVDKKSKNLDKEVSKLSPKDQALALLEQCLKLGLLKDNRRAIETAIRVIKDEGKREITDLDCKRLKFGDKPIKDTICAGLRLQPQKKGNVWIYRYKLIGENKQKEQQFGTYSDDADTGVPLSIARKLWQATQEDLRHGKQPDFAKIIKKLDIEAPAALEAELDIEKSGMTINELCNRYMSLAGKYKASWKEDLRQIDFDIKPNWGNKLVTELSHDDVDKLVTDIWDGRIVDGKEMKPAPRSAEKLVALGRFMYN